MGEFRGGFSQSQSRKSFEKQLEVCLVGRAGKGILGRGNHMYKNPGLNSGCLAQSALEWLQLAVHGPHPGSVESECQECVA